MSCSKGKRRLFKVGKLAYILDLQRLWEEPAGSSSSHEASGAGAVDHHFVSVIMVVQSNQETLLKSLQSILTQLYIREIIIVSCSPDLIFESFLTKLCNLQPKCMVVKAPPKIGLAAAYNIGAERAGGQFLLFLNAASLLPKNAVLKLMATGIQKPLPWIIGAKEQIIFAPAEKGFKNRWQNMLSKDYEHFIANKQLSSPEVTLPGGGFHTPLVAASCLFIAANVFTELKGLDFKCFHSTFHRDLCLRVHLAGGGVYCAKDVNCIVHVSAPSRLLQGIRNEWQACRGWYHFYQKYLRRKNNIVLRSLFYGKLLSRFVRSLLAQGIYYGLRKKA